MQDLKLTLLQADLAWEDPQKNLQHFDGLISGSAPTDIILLPEMFATGFTMNTSMAETMDGISVGWMRKTAKEKNCVVTGSLVIKENDLYFNRLIWMSPNGDHQYYDKRHLFNLSKEHLYYTPGKEKLIVELKGWKICPLICYDLRFPVWARNTGDYDLLIYVANWPEKRIYAWKHLLIARAIENQCYVAGVNRVGLEGSDTYYPGNSLVIDPMGEPLFESLHEERIETVAIDASKLKDVRTKLPFLADRDIFRIN